MSDIEQQPAPTSKNVDPQADVTPLKLRTAAADAELRGDWHVAELLYATADRLILLHGQNQAYRHALSKGVSVIIPPKKGLFGR